MALRQCIQKYSGEMLVPLNKEERLFSRKFILIIVNFRGKHTFFYTPDINERFHSFIEPGKSLLTFQFPAFIVYLSAMAL